MAFLYSALQAYEISSITTIGQERVYPGALGICNSNATIGGAAGGDAAACTSGSLVPPKVAGRQ